MAALRASHGSTLEGLFLCFADSTAGMGVIGKAARWASGVISHEAAISHLQNHLRGDFFPFDEVYQLKNRITSPYCTGLGPTGP